MHTPKAVIIGTGAGGLTAAATLARKGFEVIALERAKQLGGFLNPFKRGKYHFDPGVHYVGQAFEGGGLHRTLASLDIDASAMFCALDPEGFDVIRFPGFEIRMPRGLDRYRGRLIEAFPADTAQINTFFDKLADVHSIGQGGVPEQIGLSTLRGLGFGAAWYAQSFAQLLARHFSNPRIRAVLAAQYGDYGVPPSQVSALLGVALLLHFVDGAYFPRGGSGTLRDALVERGRGHGASYRRRAEVTQIEVREGAVRGVRLADGEFIEAEIVISAIDPSLTYTKLIAAEHLPAKLRAKAASTRPSVASLCVFLGLERDLGEHGLGAFNVWDYPSWDVESAFDAALRGEQAREHAFFLSPNSLKDDSGAMAPPGCSTLEIVTLAAYEPFAAWADRPLLKRGADYEAVKAEAGASLLAAVEQRWPGLIADVAVQEIATPITNQHFVGSPAGAIYGPMASRDQWGHKGYRTKGPIAGLFHAGAGTLGPGVVPSLTSGVVAAKAALASSRLRRPRFALPRALARLRTSASA